jgi:hypothetical protein
MNQLAEKLKYHVYYNEIKALADNFQGLNIIKNNLKKPFG